MAGIHFSTGALEKLRATGEIIDLLYMDDLGKEPDWKFAQIFDVKSSTKSREHVLHMSSLGTMEQVQEGEIPILDEVEEGDEHWFTHTEYGLGIAITKRTVDDDQYDKVKNLAQELFRSARYTIETIDAAVLRNAFVTNIYDGVPLCSDAHPMIRGGTQSNIYTVSGSAQAADLSQSVFEDAWAQARWMLDEAGKPIEIPMTRMVVGSSDFVVASKLLKSMQEPETANNAINPLKDWLALIEWKQLSAGDADFDDWFLLGPKEDSGLVHYWREDIYPHKALNEHSLTMTYYVRARMSSGIRNHRGIWGCQGA